MYGFQSSDSEKELVTGPTIDTISGQRIGLMFETHSVFQFNGNEESDISGYITVEDLGAETHHELELDNSFGGQP